MTTQKLNQAEMVDAVMAVCDALLDAVISAGDQGVPGGHLYAGCMTIMNLETFEAIMAAMVRTGNVTKRGQCYYAVR